MEFNEIDQKDLIKMIGSIKVKFQRIITVKDLLKELKEKKNEFFRKTGEEFLINFKSFFKHYSQKLKRNLQINLYEFKLTYNGYSWK